MLGIATTREKHPVSRNDTILVICEMNCLVVRVIIEMVSCNADDCDASNIPEKEMGAAVRLQRSFLFKQYLVDVDLPSVRVDSR